MKPTLTWPQTSRWLAATICPGREACQYEPISHRRGEAPRSNCRLQWRTHGQEVFNAFMTANPDIMFHDKSLSCIGEIRTHHRCNTRQHQVIYKLPLDHAQLCRLTDGRQFIISQPYYPDELPDHCLKTLRIWQQDLPELAWKVAGQARSWYFPSESNLIFLGPQETLDSLKLDYEAPTGSQPTGCVRFNTRS